MGCSEGSSRAGRWVSRAKARCDMLVKAGGSIYSLLPLARRTADLSTSEMQRPPCDFCRLTVPPTPAARRCVVHSSTPSERSRSRWPFYMRAPPVAVAGAAARSSPDHSSHIPGGSPRAISTFGVSSTPSLGRAQ